MSTVNHTDRLILADHVYGSESGTGVTDLQGYKILERSELDSGLEIYAIQKKGSKEVVFVTRGSDDDQDWEFNGPNMSHFLGNLSQQDKEALKFVDDFVSDEKYADQGFVYSVAGDSKGGAIAQIIAYTFGYCGTASDPAAGGGVVTDQVFLDFIKNELLTVEIPRGIPEGGFLNLSEIGSPVYFWSSIWPGTNHLGVNLALNSVDFDWKEGGVDAYLNATIMGLLKLKEKDKTFSCSDLEIIDTKLLEPPHDVSKNGKTIEGVWSEEWTIQGCGKTTSVTGYFTPDGVGGTHFEFK